MISPAPKLHFRKITEIDPNNPDGWTNIGRVLVQEGNISGAKEVLQRALAVAPALARTNFFYAKALRSEGKYDEAIAHLRTVLQQYPRDRVVHNELGRILFLKRQYPAAIDEFNATLEIDPEDLQANYNLMLCYNGLKQENRAKEYQARYLRFKADESAQSITGPYRQIHPEDNVERQAIHEHVSAPLAIAAPPNPLATKSGALQLRPLQNRPPSSSLGGRSFSSDIQARKREGL